jgi:uncharacterized membrane protein YagU involved in acid resistance
MESNEAKLVRLTAWSCIVFVALFALSWGVLGRNIPPYAPSMPADQLASIYRAHASTMRIGFAVGAFSSTFLVAWAIGLFRIMVRMEQGSQLLSYTQLIGGVLTGMVPLFACIFWLTAAFRPEQDPAIIRLLFDLGWLTIDIGFGVTILQYCALGVVAMRDTREKPLFPKWLAWLGIWISLEFLVELIMPYFRSGPFAWNGLFAYWVPFFGPFVWMIGVALYMFKATTRLTEEYESERSAAVFRAAPN